MSNKRKLKKRVPPRHECAGEARPLHICDPATCPGEGCPNKEYDLHICCDKGLKDALAAIHATAFADCPVCAGDGALSFTLGMYWLGEPERVVRCADGCDLSAIEDCIQEPPFEAYIHGCCPACALKAEGHDHPDEPEDEQPTALYRWYDGTGLLLYVGISDALADRMKGHIRASSWMDFAATSTIERHPTRALALAAEESAIKTERPVFNHQHNSSPEAQQRLVEYLVKHNRIDLLAPAISRG